MRRIGLNKGLQHRLDAVFKASKGALVKSFKMLQLDESALERVSRGRSLNEARIDVQTDRVMQA